MNLSVKHSSHYDGNFPQFRQPTEIGNFSVDGNRKYCNSNQNLKYLSMPESLSNLNMDLNAGYAQTNRKDFMLTERLDNLLHWILDHQDVIKQNFTKPEGNGLDINFVCYRGLLTSICATIYENKEDWIVCASKFKSVIYMYAYHTEQELRRRRNATERDKLMSSWGYKFEQYMVADSVDSLPDPTSVVNESEEFDIALKGRLDKHTLLFSAEVDAIDPSKVKSKELRPENTDCYVELKTSRIISASRQHQNFCRFKLLKWFLQSFLVGIPDIICGFRDDDGIVKNLQVFKVRDMPKMAEDLWSPAACLNFCSYFLNFVKSCVVKDDPNVVYKFYYKPNHPIHCEELLEPGHYKILPEWYINKLRI